MPTVYRFRLLPPLLALLVAANAWAALGGAQSGGSSACAADSTSTAGLHLSAVADRTSYVEGDHAQVGVTLHNPGGTPRELVWEAQTPMWEVRIRDSASAYDAYVTGHAVERTVVTVPACGSASLPPTVWGTFEVLKPGGRTSDTFTLEPALRGHDVASRSTFSVTVTARSGDSTPPPTTSPPPPPLSPPPNHGSSGCANYLYVTVGTERQWYRAGEPVALWVGAVNSADRDITVRWPSGQRYDFRVTDDRGVTVHSWSSARTFVAQATDEVLKPGQVVGPFRESWTLPSSGSNTYFVEGVVSTATACSAKVTLYRQQEPTTSPPPPTAREPTPAPERPYEVYARDDWGAACETGSGDSRDAWEACYRSVRDRMLVVATDRFVHERGDAVALTYGNPSASGSVPGPFTLVVMDQVRNPVARETLSAVAELGPFGRAQATWNGLGQDGRPVPGGYYILGVYAGDGRYGETTIAYGSRVALEVSPVAAPTPDFVWDASSYRRLTSHAEVYGERWLQPAAEVARFGDDAAEAMRPEPRAFEGDLFGSFACDADAVTGRFVSFSYDARTGQVDDFTVRRGPADAPVVVFTTVAVDGFQPAARGASFAGANDFANTFCRGPVFMLLGEAQVLDAQNSALASLGVRSAGGRGGAVFTLHPDAVATARDERRVEIELGDVRGWMVLAGPGRLTGDGNVVVADLGGGGQVFFQLEPSAVSLGAGPRRGEIVAAIAAGKVAAELSVATANGDALDAPVVYHPGVTRFETVAASEGRVRLFLEAESSEGQVVVVNVDPSLLRLDGGRTLRVLFDDEPAVLARDFRDLSQGSVAKYLFLVGSAGVQVLVFVPHFSPHFITLESAVELVTSPEFLRTVAITAGVAFLVVMAAAALAFRQPRPRP